MFAVFTPVRWLTESRVLAIDSSGCAHFEPLFHNRGPDSSRSTFIVSLVNKYARSFRLKLKAGQEPNAQIREARPWPKNGGESAACKNGYGPAFGSSGNDMRLLVQGQSYCIPKSFELDAEAESKAGLPPLPFVYNNTLLSGVDDGEGKKWNFFCIAELECYTLDA